MTTRDFILEHFAALPLPASETVFAAQLIPHFEGLHIAKDKSSFPALLVETENQTSRTSLVPIEIQHLHVQHGVRCRISVDEDVRDIEGLSIIQCVSSDSALQDLFLRVISEAAMILGSRPAADQVADIVGKLVTLFRALTRPSRSTVQGLWAELFVISKSRDIKRMAAFWHDEPESHFDFSLRSERLEVKSSSTRDRRHRFSLEQLDPPSGCVAWLASVFVERLAGGLSLGELANRLRSRLSDSADLLLRFEAILVDSLGSEWANANGICFDEELADGSLRVFDVRAVPCVSLPIPPSISRVRFDVDLSEVSPLESREGRDLGPLLGSLVGLLTNGSR